MGQGSWSCSIPHSEFRTPHFNSLSRCKSSASLPAKERVRGASPRESTISFSARGSRGTADPPDSESGSLERASRFAPTNFNSFHSRVAQQESSRLLPGRLVVRIHPREPASNGDHGVTGAPLLVRQKARGRHPLVTPISNVQRPSKRTAAAARAGAPRTMRRERYPGWTPLLEGGIRNAERGMETSSNQAAVMFNSQQWWPCASTFQTDRPGATPGCRTSSVDQ